MKQKKMFSGLMMIFFVIFVLIAGCDRGGGGGGGGDEEPGGLSSTVSLISGVVSDGPIVNARVSLDLNCNGKYDPGEPFSITNARGEYRIEYILDPGTEYMIVVEGEGPATLNTSDPVDNPGASLEFTMFFSLTSVGIRNSAPSAGSYQQNLTPTTFKGYLTQLSDSLGGINDVNVTNIINSSLGSVELFRTYIIDDGNNNNKTKLQAVAEQIAQIIDVENTRKDLESVGDDLGIPSGSTLDFADGRKIQELSNDLIYRNTTVSVIGDMVISTTINDVTAEDVILTNMNSAETDRIITFTVKPSSLEEYEVSVTPYESILEIPEFSGIRAGGNVVVLGADITAKDSSSVKKNDQQLTCSVTSDPDDSFADLVYYYFDVSQCQWVDGGVLSADMNIKTSSFVIVKTGTDNIIEKILIIEGLSQLDTPTVIIRGYMDSDPAEGVLTLDAFPVDSEVPASDTVSVKIPAGFIISEVVVVDSELSNVSADGVPSLSLPVTDSTQTTVSLSDGTTEMILDETLYSALKHGSPDQDFPGVGAYIDTKTVYRGIEMFLGLNVDDAVKGIINDNIYQYLDREDGEPEFDSGDGDFPGVTIDADNHTIKLLLAEEDASISVSWTFVPNSVVRTYRKNYTGGTKNNSAYSSTYTFSNASQNLINAIFEESVTEYIDRLLTLSVFYEGSAVYNRLTVSLISSKFYQRLSETNCVTMKTDTLNGLATMENDTLSFNGSYSFYLRSYDVVTGSVNITNAACARGYSLKDTTYFNNNDLRNANVLFSSASGYTLPSNNPAWLIGVWSGSFTDSCSENDGHLTMTVTGTNATWWGQSDDESRNYGTSVSVSDSTVTLMEDATIWSEGEKISDTRIEGSWFCDGCEGTYYLTKP